MCRRGAAVLESCSGRLLDEWSRQTEAQGCRAAGCRAAGRWASRGRVTASTRAAGPGGPMAAGALRHDRTCGAWSCMATGAMGATGRDEAAGDEQVDGWTWAIGQQPRAARSTRPALALVHVAKPTWPHVTERACAPSPLGRVRDQSVLICGAAWHICSRSAPAPRPAPQTRGQPVAPASSSSFVAPPSPRRNNNLLPHHVRL